PVRPHTRRSPCRVTARRDGSPRAVARGPPSASRAFPSRRPTGRAVAGRIRAERHGTVNLGGGSTGPRTHVVLAGAQAEGPGHGVGRAYARRGQRVAQVALARPGGSPIDPLGQVAGSSAG